MAKKRKVRRTKKRIDKFKSAAADPKVSGKPVLEELDALIGAGDDTASLGAASPAAGVSVQFGGARSTANPNIQRAVKSALIRTAAAAKTDAKFEKQVRSLMDAMYGEGAGKSTALPRDTLRQMREIANKARKSGFKPSEAGLLLAATIESTVGAEGAAGAAVGRAIREQAKGVVSRVSADVMKQAEKLKPTAVGGTPAPAPFSSLSTGGKIARVAGAPFRKGRWPYALGAAAYGISKLAGGNEEPQQPSQEIEDAAMLERLRDTRGVPTASMGALIGGLPPSEASQALSEFLPRVDRRGFAGLTDSEVGLPPELLARAGIR